jgi:uncharacterized SAM-binding protein YcdF (DUF218 family)
MSKHHFMSVKLNRKIMKQFVLCLALLSVFATTIGQNQNLSIPKDKYLTRSKNQETAGWILLAGGTLMAVGGAVSFDSGYNSNSNSSTDMSGFLMLSGVVVDLVSIPFFASSARNARRAATLSFTPQKLYDPHNQVNLSNPSLALTLKIRL